MKRARVALAVLVLDVAACHRTEGNTGSAASGRPDAPAAAEGSGKAHVRPDTPGVDPSVGFEKPLTSDAWVEREFPVQAQYRRVIAVGATPQQDKLSVPKLDLNRTSGAPDSVQVSIDARVATLQEAADRARGGDLVLVLPGRYAGFSVKGSRQTGPHKFIRILGLGPLGSVVIDRPGTRDQDWMIALVDTDHIILEGFEVLGKSEPGRIVKGTPRGGIFVDGHFAHSGRMAHHIAITSCHAHHQQIWGFHSTDSHHVLIQDSSFDHSGKEHGCYVSDGSDSYVIRRNVFTENPVAGLQCNLDPEAALAELTRHPKLKRRRENTRAWAEQVIRDATRLFGADQFPDGRGSTFIIEANVATRNGKRGGAAFNLAALSDSVIQNNLIYDNFASGIAQWDNNNPFDEPARHPGPKRAADVTQPEVLPVFGCQRNLIRNNTIVMSNPGRPALQSRNGSWGSRVFGNIVVNDTGPSIEIDNTSIYRFEASHNVLTQVQYTEGAERLSSLAKLLPETNAQLQIDQAALFRSLVNPGLGPWAVSAHDTRPDFRPRADARWLVGRLPKSLEPPRDLVGQPRSARALGALEP